ncbi:MAG: hypothetical protein O9342_02815 [Beijerinckiaceae bacterium]|nr:hypothetical protein [Beijerinckiaceae bacterium]
MAWLGVSVLVDERDQAMIIGPSMLPSAKLGLVGALMIGFGVFFLCNYETSTILRRHSEPTPIANLVIAPFFIALGSWCIYMGITPLIKGIPRIEIQNKFIEINNMNRIYWENIFSFEFIDEMIYINLKDKTKVSIPEGISINYRHLFDVLNSELQKNTSS